MKCVEEHIADRWHLRQRFNTPAISECGPFLIHCHPDYALYRRRLHRFLAINLSSNISGSWRNQFYQKDYWNYYCIIIYTFDAIMSSNKNKRSCEPMI